MRAPRRKLVRGLDPVHASEILEYITKFYSFSKHCRLLKDHGREFTEAVGWPQGTPRACFMNAYDLAGSSEDFTYVEGLAIPEEIPMPLEHAWVMDRQGRVVDPTWKNGKGYFGIPFEWEYVQKVAFRTKHFGILVPANRPLFDGREKNWKKDVT